MKVVKCILTQSVETYLQRIRTVLPETLAAEPDEKLIVILMEQAATLLEGVPDEMLKQFCTDLGKHAINKIDNPNSDSILLTKN